MRRFFLPSTILIGLSFLPLLNQFAKITLFSPPHWFRFLSKFSITRQEFQLLGTSALFIATKYEEIYPPDLADFVYITDDSFTKSQILLMEKTILNVCICFQKIFNISNLSLTQGLAFDVSVPTSNYFLEMFSTKLVLDKQIYCLAKVSVFCFFRNNYFII